MTCHEYRIMVIGQNYYNNIGYPCNDDIAVVMLRLHPRHCYDFNEQCLFLLDNFGQPNVTHLTISIDMELVM